MYIISNIVNNFNYFITSCKEKNKDLILVVKKNHHEMTNLVNTQESTEIYSADVQTGDQKSVKRINFSR